MERTFRTNILGMFWVTRAALPHMPKGGAIVNSTSITAYKGSPGLIDYASTKGAILAFTRSLSQQLYQSRQIRVNAVAPGPIWTPLIPATMSIEKVQAFGKQAPIGRAGQPAELAPVYVLLASDESSYVTGAVYAVTGGMITA